MGNAWLDLIKVKYKFIIGDKVQTVATWMGGSPLYYLSGRIISVDTKYLNGGFQQWYVLYSVEYEKGGIKQVMEFNSDWLELRK